MDRHERPRHPSQEPLPPREPGEIARAVSQIREGRREIVLRLVVDVANADEAFWTKVRKAQVEALLDLAEERGVLLNELAAVMGVSTSLMTKVKARHEEHPGEPPQPPGRPTPLRDNTQRPADFVDAETARGNAVTLTTLLAYATDVVKIPTTRNALRKLMKRIGFKYIHVTPTDQRRAQVNANDLEAFYNTTLPNAINGVHPCLSLMWTKWERRCSPTENASAFS